MTRPDPWAQDGFDLRFDWGPVGADRIASADATMVIVDVLSFTTAVSVAVDRGSAVYPAPWHDDRAARLAEAHDAHLAVGRREVSAQSPWSLSPASLRTGALPTRLVLPSPNGSAIAASARGTVLAGCLRNPKAIAVWLTRRQAVSAAPIAVVAAGERWPDDSLRPAVEDLLGAGAIIDALCRIGHRRLSPEAEAARACFAASPSVVSAVRSCASARELALGGFVADVDIAVEVDSSEVVPVLTAGAFRAG